MTHSGLPRGVAPPCAVRSGWHPGRLEASCGASKPTLTSPRHSGARACNYQAITASVVGVVALSDVAIATQQTICDASSILNETSALVGKANATFTVLRTLTGGAATLVGDVKAGLGEMVSLTTATCVAVRVIDATVAALTTQLAPASGLGVSTADIAAKVGPAIAVCDQIVPSVPESMAEAQDAMDSMANILGQVSFVGAPMRRAPRSDPR